MLGYQSSNLSLESCTDCVSSTPELRGCKDLPSITTPWPSLPMTSYLLNLMKQMLLLLELGSVAMCSSEALAALQTHSGWEPTSATDAAIQINPMLLRWSTMRKLPHLLCRHHKLLISRTRTAPTTPLISRSHCLLWRLHLSLPSRRQSTLTSKLMLQALRYGWWITSPSEPTTSESNPSNPPSPDHH